MRLSAKDENQSTALSTLTSDNGQPISMGETSKMQLDDRDRALRDGAEGEAMALAMARRHGIVFGA